MTTHTGLQTAAPATGQDQVQVLLVEDDDGDALLVEELYLLVIPVVMLTTSRAEEDILRSYSLHANAFVTKPVDFEHFIDAIRQIDNFFLTLVRLPV
jgi:DNA-binding NarL/FixJ family response regulator